MRLNDLLSVGNLFLKLGDKMKSLIKTTAGLVLSATMATASFGANVNIGELEGFTGPIESMAGPMSLGANLAVTEANASGKYLQGTLVVFSGDSTCVDAAAATSEAERLINDHNVMAIMGPNCSGATQAVIDSVSVPNGILTISNAATAPSLSDAKDGGLFFRTSPSDTVQAAVLAEVALARGITDMAVTHENGDYGKGLADSFVTQYTALGGTVSIVAAHENDKADYSADVAALSAGGSTTLAVFGYADTGGKGILTASEDTGAFTDYVFADGMMSATVSGLVADGSWGTMPAPSADLAAAWATVATAGGVDPGGVFTGESYDAMALIILASQAAGSTDSVAMAAEVMGIANAPGIQCFAGELGTCLKYISGGLEVDYVGAIGINFNAVGEQMGSYAEREIIGGEFTTVASH
jgi:branched-chain amino acid transport system substrate-binding protein